MKNVSLNIIYIFLFSLLYPFCGQAQTKDYQLVHQGNIEFLSKNYNKAGSYYRQVLQRNPKSSHAIFNLADTYLAQNNAAQADSLYDQVTHIEKNRTIRAMAWHNRGFIRQTQALHDSKNQQKLLREAISLYKEALRLNPQDNDTRYNLALCQHQLKENENQNEDPNNNPDNKNQQEKEQHQQTEKQNPDDPDTKPQEKQNNQPYLNLIKQAEKETLKKLNKQNPIQKTLDKNW